MALTSLEKGMAKYGFQLESSRPVYDPAIRGNIWNSSFRKNDEFPELHAVVTENLQDVTFIITSRPFDDKYTFSPHTPVDEKTALSLIDNYLQSTQHMRKSKNKSLIGAP